MVFIACVVIALVAFIVPAVIKPDPALILLFCVVSVLAVIAPLFIV